METGATVSQAFCLGRSTGRSSRAVKYIGRTNRRPVSSPLFNLPFLWLTPLCCLVSLCFSGAASLLPGLPLVHRAGRSLTNDFPAFVIPRPVLFFQSFFSRLVRLLPNPAFRSEGDLAKKSPHSPTQKIANHQNMKSIKLTFISLAALVLSRPLGLSTANAATAPDVNKHPEKSKSEQPVKDTPAAARMQQLEEQNSELQKRLALAQSAAIVPPAPPVEDNSTLAVLCRGRGVDISDVLWRMAAGLLPEQAVGAALSQKQEDERIALG